MKGSSEAKTPEEYLSSLEEPRKSDIARLHEIIRAEAPDLEPFVHSGMLAYGPYHYKYPSGREGDWFRIGLASQKQYISMYACATRPDGSGYVAEFYKEKLPKANIGKSCVRFKRLSDLDEATVRELIRETSASGFGI